MVGFLDFSGASSAIFPEFPEFTGFWMGSWCSPCSPNAATTQLEAPGALNEDQLLDLTDYRRA